MARRRRPAIASAARRLVRLASTPVYPHSLIWRSDNPHPALTALRRYLGSVRPGRRERRHLDAELALQPG